MLDLLIPTVAQGLLWALMALGVYITFRVLDIADLSVEGTFPLGAAVASTVLASGYGIGTAFIFAAVAGALAGVINVSLLRVDTVFSFVRDWGLTDAQATFIVGLVAVILVGCAIYWFFGTELGTSIRATGFNPQMARAQGINTDLLVALSGALVAQSNGFADVGMGTGTIVIGLASVIIGEVLFGTRSFKNCLIAVILGSIVYRLVIAVVLQLGMPPNDLKLFTAVLVAVALYMPMLNAHR